MAKIICLSPHASLNAMDGGSRRSRELARHWILAGHEVTEWGADYRSENGADVPLASSRRSKLLALFRCLAHRTHYVYEKIWTPEWRARLHSCPLKSADVVFASYVFSHDPIRELSASSRLVIDTHNSERAWYEGIARQTRSRLVQRACRLSICYAEAATARIAPATLLSHVSAEDGDYYRRLNPEVLHAIWPNGCRWPESATPFPTRGSRIAAYFVGSLSAKINEDALRHFAAAFWPRISHFVGFSVFGSNPNRLVRLLCHRHGWKLHCNLTDAELDAGIQKQELALLPFTYGAGSKLKLIEALAHGRTVLSTRCGAVGMNNLPPSVWVSDDPEEWAQIISRFGRSFEGNFEASRRYAREFSWASIAPRAAAEMLAWARGDAPCACPRTS